MVNATKYITILEKYMTPAVQQLTPGQFYFEDDNVSCRRAKTVNNWKIKNHIKTIDWPAQTLDLNTIEDLWHRVSLEIS